MVTPVAQHGQVIDNPVQGDQLTFHETAEETGGRLLRLEIRVQLGAAGPPEHIHPLQEERFEVVSGRIGTRVDGREQTLGPGDSLSVPAGTRHTWWNDGEEEARVMVEIEPALQTEGFFETLYGLARDGKVDATGRPNPLQIAVLLAGRHKGEMYLAAPPVLVQRAFAVLAAPIGRLRGYRDHYPEYSGTLTPGGG